MSEGRASRTTASAKVSTPWWEAIVGMLLEEIDKNNSEQLDCSMTPIKKNSLHDIVL